MPFITPRRLALALACALLAWDPAHAADNWEVVQQQPGREGINTWVRAVDGMAVKAFKGSTEVHQTALTVLAVLADIKGLCNWVYQCKRSAQADGFSPEHSYMQFKGVWPASDRDVLIRSVVTQQADGSILVESRQATGMPPQEGFVRMPYLNNSFRLVPLPGQWTRVTFETQVDLGGLVPAWLANAVSTRAPLITLQGLQTQVGLPRYQIRSVEALPAHYHQGKALVLPEGHLTP
jgi:hypothetical protein